MATRRHASDFFVVEVDQVAARVIVRRLARSFESALDAEEACRPVLDVLEELDRARYVLVMDARDARGVNDPEYETWYAPFRKRMLEGFRKTAVLVRSMSGKLQAARLAVEDRSELRVFTDPDEAERWLRAR